MYSLRQKSKE